MSDSPDFIDNDPPPPYPMEGETSNVPVAPSSFIPARGTSSSSLFSSHLINLRSQIAAEQISRTSAREKTDMLTLSLLVPCIEDLCSSIAVIHPTPKLVEATFVPEAAVDMSWHFSDEEDSQRPGEVRRLIRVGQDSKNDGKKGDGISKGFNSQAGSPLWWSDESMARRLARLLQPANRQNQEAQGGLAGKGATFRENERAKPLKPLRQSSPRTLHPDEGVSMSAKAQEVTFRRENDFGLWETFTGWGIVVHVRIRRV